MAVEKRVLLPNLGDFDEIEVVELIVSPGDRVEVEDPLVVLETDKASMEFPSPYRGVVKELAVQVGGSVAEGSLIAVVQVEQGAEEDVPPEPERRERARPPAHTAPETRPVPAPPPTERKRPVVPEPDLEPAPVAAGAGVTAHASPSVRRLAHELGVDLTLVPTTGRKGRVLRDDVQGYVKSMLEKGTQAGVPISGVSVARAPEIDFSKFGPIQTQPLNRIRKLSGANLHRSWVTVPHVTQFDEADVTDLEAFRREQKRAAEARGLKLTFLPFLMKACASVLAEFPQFNSSLDRTGENLIVKNYFHVGVAVDTDQGLVVPVVREVDEKGIFELAAELMQLSGKARDRKLRLEDLQGGTFTISSLGGIGGRFFTPIVNHPEVAVLGVSRMQWKPVYVGEQLERRLILPLSLSYDHRVIDGADAVRFTGRLAEVLTDLRLILL